jgi:hypothetical protein
MDMEIAARNIEPGRRCAGSEEQRAVIMPAAVREPDLASLRIDCYRADTEL